MATRRLDQAYVEKIGLAVMSAICEASKCEASDGKHEVVFLAMEIIDALLTIQAVMLVQALDEPAKLSSRCDEWAQQLHERVQLIEDDPMLDMSKLLECTFTIGTTN